MKGKLIEILVQFKNNGVHNYYETGLMSVSHTCYFADWKPFMRVKKKSNQHYLTIAARNGQNFRLHN